MYKKEVLFQNAVKNYTNITLKKKSPWNSNLSLVVSDNLGEDL